MPNELINAEFFQNGRVLSYKITQQPSRTFLAALRDMNTRTIWDDAINKIYIRHASTLELSPHANGYLNIYLHRDTVNPNQLHERDFGNTIIAEDAKTRYENAIRNFNNVYGDTPEQKELAALITEVFDNA